MCRVNWKNKQAEYKYFVSLPDSFFVWSSDPLKWKKKCKTAPFQLSFPQAVLGSLFQTTSERDFVFSYSPCLHWLQEGSLGLLGMVSQGCGPLFPAPGTAAAAGPCSHLRGWVGVSACESACQVFCNLDFSRQWILEINSHAGALDACKSQWASSNPCVQKMSVFTQNTSLGI